VLNADGSVAEKYDYTVYDIEGVQYFIAEYQKAATGKLTETDMTLIDQSIAKIDQAKEKEKERKIDEAQALMQEVMDLVTNSESPVAPDLRDGIADYIENTAGDMRMRDVNVEENIDRRNYRKADNIDYRDGDFASSNVYGDTSYETDNNRMYEWGQTTLINNRARVYKGGNWRDRAYYTIPGTRRFLDERRSMATLGFRCAMTRVGSPTGLGARDTR
jgi:hypothetical protein